MVLDIVTSEIRSIRHALAAKFENDIARIGNDLRRQQKESGLAYIRLPKREPRKLSVTDVKSTELLQTQN